MSDSETPSSRGIGKASIREVADRAGVAISSVSRVLSGHPDVSERMRSRVNQAVEELGYVPDFVAQSLRRQSTRSIGFVVADISNPLFAQIAQGAESTFRARGYSMMITNSEGDPTVDAEHVRLFLQRRVDAMLLSLASETDAEVLRLLRELETPVVVIDRNVPADLGASAVLSDHRQGMREAVEHLLALGHRRIGLINGDALRPPQERLAALQEVYAARGLEPTYQVVAGPVSPAQGRAALAQLLDGPEPPTAVITGTNRFLIGALQELQARGLRVGADLSLVSCDEIDLTAIYDPPIAVIARDNRELGRRAGELALAMLDEPGTVEQVLLPTTFTPRASCVAIPAT